MSNRLTFEPDTKFFNEIFRTNVKRLEMFTKFHEKRLKILLTEQSTKKLILSFWTIPRSMPVPLTSSCTSCMQI